MVIIKTHRRPNSIQKTSTQSYKTQIKTLPFPGLANRDDQPGPGATLLGWPKSIYFTNYLMNLPRNYGTYNKRRIIMHKSGEEKGSNLKKQQQSWPKISNTARKYDKDENLENYDSEVQMHARAHSGP